MEQNGSFRGEDTGGSTGAGQAAGPSRSVFEAEPGADARLAESGALQSDSAHRDPVQSSDFGPAYRDGLTGSLALQAAESLTQAEASAALSRLDALVRWAQAQQAKVLHRMETVFRDDLLEDIGREDPALTFSLAAEEVAAILHLPATTAKMLMSDAGRLCSTHTATLRKLEQGTLSYGHVQTVLDQSRNVPDAELARFEADLLATAAAGQTSSQFRVKARRMRERTYPETIEVRHKTAFERRRVCLVLDEDGMSWLSALLPAARAQLIYTQLTTAARGEQAAGDPAGDTAGDPRGVDALRADILADLLDADPDADGGDQGSRDTHHNRDNRGSRGSKSRTRTEILVLITAETLFGADEQPAELHGYGPISPDTARRLARQAARWTSVERHRDTDEILRVGRRRKVPAGLQRWLRVRDGTCRFPGCRTNAVISEIDHTKPWSHGGTTDHDNLEHLCRRHHMFKSRGFWKAHQHSPGIIEWTSPGGRAYRTDPHLTLASGSRAPGPGVPEQAPGMRTGLGNGLATAATNPAAPDMSGWSSAGEPPQGYGDEPTPAFPPQFLPAAADSADPLFGFTQLSGMGEALGALTEKR